MSDKIRRSSQSTRSRTLDELKDEVKSLRKSQLSQKENPFRTSEEEPKGEDEGNTSEHGSAKRVTVGSRRSAKLNPDNVSKHSNESKENAHEKSSTEEAKSGEIELEATKESDNSETKQGENDVNAVETSAEEEEVQMESESAESKDEDHEVKDETEIKKSIDSAVDGITEADVIISEEVEENEIKEESIKRTSKISKASGMLSSRKGTLQSAKGETLGGTTAKPQRGSFSLQSHMSQDASFGTNYTLDTLMGQLQGEVKKLYQMKPRTSYVSMVQNYGGKDRKFRGHEMITYQLAPTKLFSQEVVEPILSRYIIEAVKKITAYRPELAEFACTFLAATLRSELSFMYPKRYKITVMVMIGQKKYQGFHVDCRMLWAREYDNITIVTEETSSYFLQILTFATYKD